MVIVATPPAASPRSKVWSWPHLLFWMGLFLLITGFFLIGLLLFPALQQEFRYWKKTTLSSPAEPKTLTAPPEPAETQPLDTTFGIVIPKIEANARVIPGVDWRDPSVYQRALREGVAHAEGTALPGQGGNTFIFAHSGLDFSEAARYNAVFYLMNKLVAGDEVKLWYEGKLYRYQVVASKKVSGEAVEYLTQDIERETLTLMTCWPAGTTWKRLIVQAERVL